MRARGQIESNFEACLMADGQVVPGSVRRGHNVITSACYLWLSRLVAWQTIRDVATEPTLDDVPWGGARVRWFGVGTGLQVETIHVSALATPAAVNGTPDYLKLGSVAPAYPDASRRVPSGVLFTCQFDKPDLPGDPEITEAGLFVDLNDTGGVYGVTNTAMPATTQYAIPIAYKAIDPPLQKLTGFHNLLVKWELRF